MVTHWLAGVPKTAEHKRKIAESLKGHVTSEETKAKIAASLKGTRPSVNAAIWTTGW